MSIKQLIIAATTLFSIGVVIALVTTGFFDKTKSNENDLTIEKALESANNEAIGDQDLAETAKNIVQSGIVEGNTDNLITATFESEDGSFSESEEYNTFVTFEKQVELDKYKVDTLLDNSVVYSLGREDIKSLNLETKFFNLNQNKNICINKCILIKTKTKYIIANSGLYYLSSFSANDKIFWLGFVKNSNDYTFAQISEPEFRNAQIDSFVDENIIKINQKGPNSSEYSFDIKDKDSIVVDFKDSSAVTDANNESLGED